MNKKLFLELFFNIRNKILTSVCEFHQAFDDSIIQSAAEGAIALSFSEFSINTCVSSVCSVPCAVDTRNKTDMVLARRNCLSYVIVMAVGAPGEGGVCPAEELGQ